jgi:putative endonuclease
LTLAGVKAAPPRRPFVVVSTRRLTLGHVAEDAAAKWYADHGYRILARNWRCARGEIDIVCARRNPAGCTTLVVCEVKARTSSSHGHPLEAVTPAKQRRLRQLATLYLASQDAYYDHLRFDVAAGTRHGLHITESAF